MKDAGEISCQPTGDKSIALAPLWANGAGAEQFVRRLRGRDRDYAQAVGWNDGCYIGKTDVAVMGKATLEGAEGAEIPS